MQGSTSHAVILPENQGALPDRIGECPDKCPNLFCQLVPAHHVCIVLRELMHLPILPFEHDIHAPVDQFPVIFDHPGRFVHGNAERNDV
jgi:hypothetical protein